MKLRYHGLLTHTPHSGQLRFGIGRLIGSCQSWLWDLPPDVPDYVRDTLSRFNSRAYWQCAAKCRDTVHKLNKAVRSLSECIDIFERSDEYAYDGAPIEKAAVYYRAADDIPYHLDSLITYLRILADCVAFAIPFFYHTRQSIANRSFRDHRKWFVEKSPRFDPEYVDVLQDHSKWFDRLAGKQPKGIRDVVFHRFGTYQLGRVRSPTGESRILIQQITSNGIEEQDLVSTISEIIAGFFSYLDATYSVFGKRMARELEPLPGKTLEEWSVFMGFTDYPDLRASYRLYPLIDECEHGGWGL